MSQSVCLVAYHAKKLNVNDEENLELINNMTLAGLHFDFFGDARGEPDEAISEQEFNITIDEVDKLYRLLAASLINYFTKIKT